MKRIGYILIAIIMAAGVVTAAARINLRANTTVLEYDNPSNYSFDSNKISVSGGFATLRTKDQTDDAFDSPFGFGSGSFNATQWDGTNEWVELTAAGQSAGTGTFTSRIMDVGGVADWSNINWVPERPYLKELPDGGTETVYGSGNIDMSDAVALWHMNESVWNGSNNEVMDSVGANNGKAINGTVTTASGKFNRAGSFDGTNDYVLVGDKKPLEFTDQFTISGWFYFTGDINSARLLEKGSDTDSDFEYRIFTLDGGDFGFNDGLVIQLSEDGSTAALQAACNGCLSTLKDEWVHIAARYNGTNLRLYINGAQAASANGSVTIYNNKGDFAIGADGVGNFPFGPGMIDELAMFDVDMGATAIEDMYKRGALRLKYQVRSCDDGACAGESFVGPDGTASTYYSELSNASVGLPEILLGGSISNNRYFQYRATFESDNGSFSPALNSVSIGPTHYDAGNPTITNNEGIAYQTLADFIQTLAGGANQGSVEYQLSNDGVNYYYHNGASWVVQTGGGYGVQTNTAAEISGSISSFPTDVGTGDLFVRAFMHSEFGEQQLSIDHVLIDYQPPVGGGGGGGQQAVVPKVNAFTVNNGDDCAASSLVSLQFDVENAQDMLISENELFVDAQWEPYSATREWAMSAGDGYKMVFAKFRSASNNTSEMVSDVIYIDTAGGCNGEDEIPDPPTPEEPDDVTPPDTGGDTGGGPGCETNCDRVTYDVYIVNPDGTERHMNSEYVRVEQFGDDFLLWFEDKGDMDFNDLIVRFNFVDCGNVLIAPVLVNAGWHHQIRLAIKYDGLVAQDVLLWEDSHTAPTFVKRVNVYDWPNICAVSPEDIVDDEEPPPPIIEDPIKPTPPTPDTTSCRTPVQFTLFMNQGDVSSEIRALQELLQCLGYFPDYQPSTAIYGPITANAVARFQEDNGILPVGYVGPATRTELNKYYSQ